MNSTNKRKKFLSTTFLNTIHYGNTEAECQQASLLLRSKSPCCTGMWTRKESNLKTETTVSFCVKHAEKELSYTAESVMSRKNPTKK